MPGRVDATFAGAEANAAVAIARLGGAAEFVSALPANPIANAALGTLRGAGVGVRYVLRRDAGRCGLYFVETGASQRGGLVVYDREGSTFALSDPGLHAWPEILAGAAWFHTTGIGAGVSRLAADATLAGIRGARAAGQTVSCDLNFRRKLWRWDAGTAPEVLAQRTLAALLPHVDVLIGNAYDIATSTGEIFAGTETDGVGVQTALASRAAARFPNLQWIVVTLRENSSASQNKCGALLLRAADAAVFTAPQTDGRYSPYEIHRIVDRVGTGDVFAGALIFALQTPELAEPSRALSFATAASCLAHSTKGDFFQGTRAEVEALMNGDTDGHLSR